MAPIRTPRKPLATATWAEALQRFMANLLHLERSPHTVRHYGDDLSAFARWWAATTAEELTPGAITPVDASEWKRYLRETPLDQNGRKRKPAAINAKMNALKSFLRWAHGANLTRELIASPPPEKLGPKPVKWLEPRDQRRLLREAARWPNPRTLPMIELMLETGVRAAELVGLRRRDVILTERKGQIEIRAGKGRKPRTIPLNYNARAAMRKLLALNADPRPVDPVIMSQRREPGDRDRNRPLTTKGLFDHLERFKVHPHQLRHTFGMNLVKAGRPFTEVAILMGHSSVVTTMQHYGTPSFEDLRRAVDPHGEDTPPEEPVFSRYR